MGIGHWALDIRHGHEIKRKSLSFYTRYNFFMLKLTYFRLFMYVHTIRNWAAPGTAMLETTNSKYFQHSYVVTACAHCWCFSAHCFCFCFHRFDFHFLLCVSSFFFHLMEPIDQRLFSFAYTTSIQSTMSIAFKWINNWYELMPMLRVSCLPSYFANRLFLDDSRKPSQQ